MGKRREKRAPNGHGLGDLKFGGTLTCIGYLISQNFEILFIKYLNLIFIKKYLEYIK